MAIPSSSRWGLLSSLAVLIPLFAVIIQVSLKFHYELPTPIIEPTNPKTGLPQLSEAAILSHSRHLSEEIGFRIVGTREHAVGDKWMHEQALALQSECQRLVRQTDGRRHLECEVWRQEGNGTHRFDMMNKIVYKNYVKLTNIVVRLSNGTPEGKKHAVAVNAHVDSTLPSPGAGDDALSVGVMIECIRVLIQTPEWEPENAIVFLFNNGEESIQDASHLFATQHETAPSLRAIINLEAAGTTGPELLFQATSEEMIEAYSHVPRPYGTVLANEVFSSGVILSDTDFRQFQEYRNLTGLDMAVVGNSYLYHTRKDLVEHIEPGAAQHMAENTLALLLYLSSSASPLPNLGTYTPPTTVFFALAGRFFFSYSFQTANRLYAAMLLASLALTAFTTEYKQLGVYPRAMLGVIGAFVGAILSSNAAAFLMARVFGKGMSWFSHEWLCVVLYAPPAVVGILVSQYLFSSRLPKTLVPSFELASITSLHLFLVTVVSVVQFLGIGSAGFGYLLSLSTFSALFVNSIRKAFDKSGSDNVHLSSYIIGQLTPLTMGVEVAVGFLDMFVPLTGRMGEVAPVEHIIATITAFLTITVFPLAIPFAHRFGRRILLANILTFALLSIIAMGIFAQPKWSPFDTMHQKRFFGLHIENITSGDYSLDMAACDAAPDFQQLVDQIATEFGAPHELAAAVEMDDRNPDWDVLYPFSQFLTTYKLQIPQPQSYVSPWVKGDKFRVFAARDSFDSTTGLRTLTIQIDHHGIIWSVISFDAHVLAWSLDDNPTPHHTRHHIKEASFYGVDTWSVDLVIQAPPDQTSPPPLSVNFIGIQEKGMWPAKKNDREGPAMDMFERMDSWLYDKTQDGVDAMLLSCIAGVALV